MAPSRRAAILLSLLVILAGCAGGSGESTSAPPSSTTIATSTVPVPTSTTSTASASSTAGTLAPITGYGDFSDQEFFDTDWFLVTRLTVQCLQDQGFPVALVPPGDGISFYSVPVSQNQLAQQYLEACRAGLNLPDFEYPTTEQLEVMYAYYVALRDCLIDEGYSISEPSSLDEFIESYATGPWTPYLDVPGGGAGWDSIQVKCPQGPPGGWASWEPGDPIIPIPAPPDL